MSTHLINILNFSLRHVGFALVVCLSVNAQSAEPKLPRAMAWSAYNLGTTGYNQAVGIAKMLKDEHRVTLRVIPGKNDVSRLLPLMVNRVQFSANGVSTYFAQEGVFQFTSPRWGPIPVRLVLMSLGLSNQGIAVAANSEIERIADLRSKSVPYVLGAPALNVSTEAILACGGLSWADVQRVEFPGYDDVSGGRLASVTSVFLESEAHDCNLLASHGGKHAVHHAVGEAVFLPVVHEHHLIPVRGNFGKAESLAEVHEVEDILLEA